MSELNEALAKGKTLEFLGREWRVLPLDFNDLVEIEDEIGDVEKLDVTKLKHQLFLLWLALRKADPTLGDDDRKNCRYRMTQIEVGQMVDFDSLKKPETVSFILEVLMISGVLPRTEAATEDAKKKQTRRRSPSESAG